MQLYDLDVEFVADDELAMADLESICKFGSKNWGWLDPRDDVKHVGRNPTAAPDSWSCRDRLTPEGMNRWEVSIIEDQYHDDSETLHLVWGTVLRNDDPLTPIDSQLDYDVHTPTGIAYSNGAPGTGAATVLEKNEWGMMVAAGEFSDTDVRGLQSVTMHELGHTLGIGWADDTAIEIAGYEVVPKGMEVYSGDIDGDGFESDDTPEEMSGMDLEWSIMAIGAANDHREGAPPQLAYSLEELSTIDFEEIPSREE